MTKSWRVPIAEQMRCELCGSLFLVADEHSRLDKPNADRLRMRVGTPICHACWFAEILVDETGQPRVFTGHA